MSARDEFPEDREAAPEAESDGLTALKLRATLKIRNEHMLAARQARGWSQHELAKQAGVGLKRVLDLEALNYSSPGAEDAALKIACALKLETDRILPPEAAGRKVKSTFTEVKEVQFKMLPLDEANVRMLPDPKDCFEDFARDVPVQIQRLLEIADERLTRREREILKLYFGLEEDGIKYTLEEIGRKLKICRERVRAILFATLRQLKKPECIFAIENGRMPTPRELLRLKADLIDEHLAGRRPKKTPLDTDAETRERLEWIKQTATVQLRGPLLAEYLHLIAKSVWTVEEHRRIREIHETLTQELHHEQRVADCG